jgi:hypothetical protein
MPELLFPFFVFEIKSIVGTTFSAANQLSNSLSYALGIIRKLRADATSEPARQRLHLFGAVSSGTTWQIYIAYEADPTQPNLECVIYPAAGKKVDCGVTCMSFAEPGQGLGRGYRISSAGAAILPACTSHQRVGLRNATTDLDGMA